MKNTTLCYIERNSSYLMLHRVKKLNDVNKDKWIGIGGHCEEGESPEDCVTREVLEETGLTLEGMRYCGIVTFVADNCEGEYMHLFHSDSFSGQLKECDEGVLEWVPIASLNKLEHWQGDEIFLDLIGRKVPFFSLKLVYSAGRLLQAVLDGKELPEPISHS
ncbi:MAG: 8-oxo-dGTP diphosphatase [Treponema sp.]|nr:8-oxo-dGTP diphosphatase [Treponema sp.]